MVAVVLSRASVSGLEMRSAANRITPRLAANAASLAAMPAAFRSDPRLIRSRIAPVPFACAVATCAMRI
jgi:hypothetical protein